nr:immunoglobulin light chain junction region [Macaca mulatta]MOX77444.1 immunoglobulin light chain junction region [Macaca mulatta]MOX77462.1 immunoglobulin light chain junction region [Macaca mulatta]MOX77517.1 immunoglobulin light chain junction region [Macaca mulatta]MOX77536.1 immunoglobulin light chain junction region [Macaca mulatta]
DYYCAIWHSSAHAFF